MRKRHVDQTGYGSQGIGPKEVGPISSWQVVQLQMSYTSEEYVQIVVDGESRGLLRLTMEELKWLKEVLPSERKRSPEELNKLSPRNE